MTYLDMFIKWLIIFVILVIVIGVPAYLFYLVSQYKNKSIIKNKSLADKVNELEMRVRELENKI